MNILEWAIGDKKFEDYFERIEESWHIETEKLPGGYCQGSLQGVVEYFKDELGLKEERECYRCEHCCQGFGYCGDVSDVLLEKTFNRIMVTDEANGLKWDSKAKYPYFQLRGRRLTKEEAFEMIARTDLLFDISWDCRDNPQLKDEGEEWFSAICRKGYRYLGYDHFVNDYISGSIYNGGYGYIWPDGRVGLNDFMHKYPDTSEIIDQLMDWALAFPYFDAVLVITKWESISPQRQKAQYWRYSKNYDGIPHPDADLDEYEKPYEPITAGDVDLCIEVRHGILNFLKPEDGLKKLAEYDSFYTEEERRQFPASDFYRHTHIKPFDEEYLVRLLNYYGEVPECIMEYQLKKFRKAYPTSSNSGAEEEAAKRKVESGLPAAPIDSLLRQRQE